MFNLFLKVVTSFPKYMTEDKAAHLPLFIMNARILRGVIRFIYYNRKCYLALKDYHFKISGLFHQFYYLLEVTVISRLLGSMADGYLLVFLKELFPLITFINSNFLNLAIELEIIPSCVS